MGSITPPAATKGTLDALPDSSSPSLVLTHPTEAERRNTWSLTHPKWGPALSREDYVAREAYMTTVPLARDGGIQHWVLTDAGSPPDKRPILSSCESLRKRAIAACPPALDKSGHDREGVTVVEGVAHGIGSVFTDPQFRGRGYADRMMREVGALLCSSSDSDSARCGEGALFSVLYSDIGRTFYAKRGWRAFPSRHVSFRPLPTCENPPRENPQEDPDDESPRIKKITSYHQLAELADEDVKRVRRLVSERALATGKTCVALLPDLDQLFWHLMREDYMTEHIFGKTPVVRGAVYASGGDEKKQPAAAWALWTRGYYGGLQTVEGNTLHILRFVIADEMSEAEALDAFRRILEVARVEAAAWRSQEIHLWNPGPLLARLIRQSGLEHTFVERETESIASLMWCGGGRETAEDLEWVANEKYGWC